MTHVIRTPHGLLDLRALARWNRPNARSRAEYAAHPRRRWRHQPIPQDVRPLHGREGEPMNETPNAENGAPIPLNPIDPTVIGPGLAVVPMSPTVWDDLQDWQHALTPDGIVWQRRRGLWWAAPWWQTEDAAQIKAVCADPDEWAYGSGWPRKMVEDAHGPLEPITLPGDGYPHEDERCRQDSVDAEGFREVCRQVARLADALGLRHAGSLTEVIDLAITRVLPPAKPEETR